MKRLRYRAAGTGSKKRLFQFLALFFIALSLPVYLLLNRVYAQLENEMFFNARQQAERLVEHIDQELQAGLLKEQERPIAEYSFFNVLENPLLNASGLKFSPLSDLPPKTGVAGLIGYFQIDADGSFHIPALPDLEKDMLSGLSSQELDSRLALKAKLKALLAVAAAHDEKIPAAKPALKDEMGQASNEIQKQYVVEEAPEAESMEGDKAPAKSNSLTGRQLQELNIDTKQWLRESSKSDYFRKKKTAPSEYKARKETVRLPEQSITSALLNRPQKKEAAAPKVQAEKMISDADFKSMDQAAEFQPGGNAVERIGAAKLFPKEEGVHGLTDQPVILSFESEVGPLQMIKLASGNLCFYRQVWHNHSRFIQGFVADGNAYFQAVVLPLFNEAGFSSLLVGYQGEVLRQFGKTGGQAETLLYRSNLLPPFQSVELIVNIAGFEPGPGKRVVDMLALSLAFILLGGVFIFYRLGSKQIDLSRQQQNFISAVSHELKTPLTSIRMYGEMLRSGWVSEETRKKTYYDYIFFESERLSRLIANVLQLAKLDNEQIKPELTGVSPELLLQRLQAKIAAQIEASAFVLYLQPPKGLAEGISVNVDEDAFYQIVINLVDNAVKFASGAERKEIDIGFYVRGQQKEVVFFVRDYGPGITRDQIKKIFRLFYRAGDEMTRTRPGTGIGLALAEQLAATMNAVITVENRQPGAEFQIRLSCF
jgi:signal transduction histidine kinase